MLHILVIVPAAIVAGRYLIPKLQKRTQEGRPKVRAAKNAPLRMDYRPVPIRCFAPTYFRDR
jgi:hypothetical protein